MKLNPAGARRTDAGMRLQPRGGEADGRGYEGSYPAGVKRTGAGMRLKPRGGEADGRGRKLHTRGGGAVARGDEARARGHDARPGADVPSLRTALRTAG